MGGLHPGDKSCRCCVRRVVLLVLEAGVTVDAINGYKCCIALRTFNYGDYGICFIMDKAGFISSNVVIVGGRRM